MLKKQYKIILVFFLVVSLSFVIAYTPPSYNSVNFTMCSGYTPPIYNDINFTLGESYDCFVANDTCSCPGIGNNWEVDLEDYCVITTNCNLGSGKLSFINIGNFTVDAIIDTSDMGDPGSGGIIWMNDEGVINVA